MRLPRNEEKTKYIYMAWTDKIQKENGRTEIISQDGKSLLEKYGVFQKTVDLELQQFLGVKINRVQN